MDTNNIIKTLKLRKTGSIYFNTSCLSIIYPFIIPEVFAGNLCLFGWIEKCIWHYRHINIGCKLHIKEEIVNNYEDVSMRCVSFRFQNDFNTHPKKNFLSVISCNSWHLNEKVNDKTWNINRNQKSIIKSTIWYTKTILNYISSHAINDQRHDEHEGR